MAAFSPGSVRPDGDFRNRHGWVLLCRESIPAIHRGRVWFWPPRRRFAGRASLQGGSLQVSRSRQTMRTDSRDGQVVGKVVPVRFECMLNSSYCATEQLATLAHELGHLYCGHLGTAPEAWWKDRRDTPHEQTEFEAETTAQLVFRRIAPDAELPPHLDQYCHPGAPKVTGDWSVITRAASRVIEMCPGDSPKRK